MSYIKLEEYYKLLFSLQQFHNWNINMVEYWTPYDREIWVSLLSNHIEEENSKNANN